MASFTKTVTNDLNPNSTPQRVDASARVDGDYVAVMLMNGTVYGMDKGQSVFQRNRVDVEITLYDAPLLIVKQDAMLPIVSV